MQCANVRCCPVTDRRMAHIPVAKILYFYTAVWYCMVMAQFFIPNLTMYRINV